MNQPSLILIVDDEPQNLKRLGSMLTNRGYRLLFAESGTQALNAIKDEKPHLILLDIMMPGMDGFEVCQKLRQDATTKDIPVIFLTAHSEKEKVIQGFQLGGVDYVTKPFNTEELISRVHTHIKLKVTEEQLKQKLEELETAKEKIEAKKEELASTVEQLKEANASKEKFFSIVAHDLGNLFNGLIGVSELLIAHEPTAEEKETFLPHILQTSIQDHDLLTNLLEWSKVQTGRIKAQPVTVDLKSLVELTIEFLDSQAEQKKINMVSNIDQTSVLADENMLDTVLRNLLSNAIKFTPQNGKVEIYSIKTGGDVEISIKDNGVGIKPENTYKLFRIDVSHTTMGTANEKGSGLGLILCQEFVEKNGGTIGVESEEGKGSRFYIRLPSASVNYKN